MSSRSGASTSRASTSPRSPSFSTFSSPPSTPRTPPTPRTPSSARSGHRRHHSKPHANGTTYALAHPAPVYTDKTHIIKHLRPRRYLQLQRLSDDGRHYQPFIDVLSVAPLKNPTGMASIFRNFVQRMRGGQNAGSHCLAFDRRDIMLAKTLGSQEALASGASFEDLTRVVAVLRADNKVVLEDGRAWTASRRSAGSFEFTYTSEHGYTTVARWVNARPSLHRGSTSSSSSAGSAHQEFTYHFSLINPSSRRHAVLATLGPTTLHVKDTYQQPLSSFGSREEFNEGKVHVVDESTRTLIWATAVWMSLYLEQTDLDSG